MDWVRTFAGRGHSRGKSTVDQQLGRVSCGPYTYENINVFAEIPLRMGLHDLLDGRTRIQLLASSHVEISRCVSVVGCVLV